MDNVIELRTKQTMGYIVEIDYSHGRIYFVTDAEIAVDILNNPNTIELYHDDIKESLWYEDGGFLCFESHVNRPISFKRIKPEHYNDNIEYRIVV